MTARFSHEAHRRGDERPYALATELGSAVEESAQERRFEFGPETTAAPSGSYIPEYYEPNYAYPLLIWLHDEGGSERDLLSIMPDISTRNYFGLSLRGPLGSSNSKNGYRWSQEHEDVVAIENEIHEEVRQLRRTYHLHTERVFVGGLGQGATLALQLGLHRPEWFAGVVSIGGEFPSMDKPLAKYRFLQGKRTLLAADHTENQNGNDETLKLGTLLHTAGMTVCTRHYDAGVKLQRDILLDIDRWMMQECYRTVTVE